MPYSPEQQALLNHYSGNTPWAGKVKQNLMGQFDVNNQQQSGLNSYQQGANVNLFDKLDPQTLAMLKQIYGQENTNLTNAQNNALGGANRSAGAYASSQGYSNPYSFQERSRNNVYNAFAPQFGNLSASQGENLLNSTSQSNQFKRQGFFGLGGAQMDNARFQEMIRQFQEQMNNNPGFGESLFGNLLHAGGTLGGAAILASDIRLKKNIVKIGKTSGGINLYRWDWKSGGSSSGVIAQEVQKIIPEAIHTIGGFLHVDYSMVR